SPPTPIALLASLLFCNVLTTIAPYPLSLHDALPISRSGELPPFRRRRLRRFEGPREPQVPGGDDDDHQSGAAAGRQRRVRLRPRSEEHTSELQSRENLVCRLLLEKKKYICYHVIDAV